ncbi:MAG TPA: NrsF family protein [Polyangiaceae bacterium LLY-WYZ-15_(1-7)]|nr:NrsF family protein [Polyangiaceae bacterium LLY-WYZ-15_(1-7)]HJL10432.1 NrsF family protein [Polyangiaceae bacterium LLY-WYZ-15_(1-7)]HJL37938.1 NrsF family protein [Polyangiaceae bacterium LLY-WYZ-15_(1-7)]HJL44612.1 NrsF family protein [Polyangiaceae bacterium LLY-WYZ-15_(1-7)]
MSGASGVRPETAADERRAELEALLGRPEATPELDLDGLFAGVRERVEDAERSPSFRLKAQSTPRRRLLGLLAVLGVIAANLLLGTRPDLGTYGPGLLAASFGSLGVLVLLAVFAALRPTHRPPLPRWQVAALTAASLAATVVLAVVPGYHAHAALPEAGRALGSHALPCLVYGFLVGVPVYAALRLLDRGSPLSRVVAASAAGLAGNLVLELHCPTGGPAHLLAGHAGVVALYVVGVGLLEAALRHRD